MWQCACAQLYGVSLADVDADPRLLERRLDMAHSAAVVLDRHNLIKYDRRSGNFQVCACSGAAGSSPPTAATLVDSTVWLSCCQLRWLCCWKMPSWP
jgi:hypothetical protein